MKNKKEADLLVVILLLAGLFVFAQLNQHNLSGLLVDNVSQTNLSNSTDVDTTSTTSTSSTSTEIITSTTSSTESSSSTTTSSTSTTESSTSTTSSTSTSSTSIEIKTFIGSDYRRKATSEARNSWTGNSVTTYSGGQKISVDSKKNYISGNSIKDIGGSNKLLVFLFILITCTFLLYNYSKNKTAMIFIVIFAMLVLVGYLNLNGKVTLSNVSNSTDYEIDNIVIGDSIGDEISYNQLPSLQKTKLNLNGQKINAREELELGRISSGGVVNTSDSISIDSALSANKHDYETNLYMNIKGDLINYHYIFDGSVDLTQVTSTDPLNLKFLGRTLNIARINSINDFTAQIGNENFMKVGDSLIVDRKNVTLRNVGSNSVLVSVDGTPDVVDLTQTKTINSLQINIGSIFYSYNTDERSAMLRIGEKAIGVFKDGDPYVNENEDNPNWIWDIGQLTTVSTGDSYSGDGGPTIGVKNSFSSNDRLIGVGECIPLPNNYLDICFDSITKTNFGEYYVYYDNSCSLESADNKKCIVIETSVKDGLNLVTGNNFRTNKILLTFNQTIGKIDVYFKNSENKIQLSNTIDTAADVLIGDIYYGKTSQNTMELHLLGTSNVANNMELDMQINGQGRVSSGRDDLHIPLSHSTSDFSGIRGIQWGTSNSDLTNVENDVRSSYGYIIKDPKNGKDNNRITLDIPNEQIKAKVVIKNNELV